MDLAEEEFPACDDQGNTKCERNALTGNSREGVLLRVCAAVALIISLIATPCAAMEISRVTGCDGGDVLKLSGDIKAGDYVKFRAQFGVQRRIAGLVLDSPGGSLREGVRIAMLTRQKKLSTFVTKECDSACAAGIGNDLASGPIGTMRQRLQYLPEPPPVQGEARWTGALGLCLLSFLSTFPVVIPFLILSDARLALRVSYAVAIGMLFCCGYVFGIHSGLRPGRRVLRW